MVGTIIWVTVLWLVTGYAVNWAIRRYTKAVGVEISRLKRENLQCATAIAALKTRVDALLASAEKTTTIALDNQAMITDHENRLTMVETQPKIADVRQRTRTVPFRQFKSVAESLPEEE
jgi:hypothetical protein